jgi:hypothetical protein
MLTMFFRTKSAFNPASDAARLAILVGAAFACAGLAPSEASAQGHYRQYAPGYGGRCYHPVVPGCGVPDRYLPYAPPGCPPYAIPHFPLPKYAVYPPAKHPPLVEQAEAPDAKAPVVENVNLSGDWVGTSYYPPFATQHKPFSYNLVLTHEEQKITGSAKEPNTFGPDKENQPWLNSLIRGSFDARRRGVTVVKKYDGANGVAHALFYGGVLSADGMTIRGRWSSLDDPEWGGAFHFRRAVEVKQADPQVDLKQPEVKLPPMKLAEVDVMPMDVQDAELKKEAKVPVPVR